MERRERRFALTISGAHGIDHLLKRVFPPLIPIWAVGAGAAVLGERPDWSALLALALVLSGIALSELAPGPAPER